jgi:hypothetical protein
MNTKRFASTTGVLLPSFLFLTAVAGCSASDNGTPGTGGSPGAGDGGGIPAGTQLTFNATGFVPMSATNYGVVGSFYKYGDGLGSNAMPPGKCQLAGHTNCSTINITFDAVAQKICATGTIVVVEAADYGNMFGSAIGFELNNAGAEAGTGKMPYNATTNGVTGVGFTLTGVYGSTFRIEFPAVGQDGSGNGAEDSRFFTVGTSVPISTAGAVVAKFATATVEYNTTPPQTAPVKGDQLLGFQWHVATNGSMTAPFDFDFCISNIHLLTN